MPLEDVAGILVTSPRCVFHSHLLAECGVRRIPLVVCQDFRPSGIFLPVCRATDTLLTRAQIQAPARLRKTLWQKTVDAKCENQRQLAETLTQGRHPNLEKLRVLCAHPSPAKEGPCAHLYWDLCAESMQIEAFARTPSENDGLNALLNYAYALLLTQTLQTLLLLGIDPQYGIGHAVRERATPLAYDIMEPFRPLVDAWVLKWFEYARRHEKALSVTPSYKTFLRQCIAGDKTPTPPLRDLLTNTAKGLREAFLRTSAQFYQPWQQKTTKWVGYLSALISP